MRYSEIINEAARAPLYHSTGIQAAITILRDGMIRAKYDVISTSRDQSFRYSPGNEESEYGLYPTQGGHGPVQFVLDTNAISSRYKIKPYDYAGAELEYQPDEWQTARKDDMLRREREERIYARFIPVDRKFVQSIILEPVTASFLNFSHTYEDEDYLIGEDDRFIGVKPSAYHQIISLARHHGIPIIDRRTK